MARRPSGWSRDYLREVALADLGCAVVGRCVSPALLDVAGPRTTIRLPQLFNVFLGRMSLVGPQPTCGTSGAC